MNSLAELQNRGIVAKIENDISEYARNMNKNDHIPMYPEKQISDAIDYLRGEDCIKDIDVTCEQGNVTENGTLNVTLDVMLKPKTNIDISIIDNDE